MKIRFFIQIIVVSCTLLFFNSCYLITQGVHLINYTTNAQSTKKMLKDPNVSLETKQFVDLVNKIRTFALDSLGLTKNSNYTKYVDVNRDYLIDVVSAAEELSFKQYMWCFPIFGCFPNKGFFKRSDAEREAEKLANKGYDIIIDKVDAFSTLGILSDPLYSFMENFSIFQLASIIIHEQTHATLFLKNQLQFNEELATYIGTKGALQFIKYYYDKDTLHYSRVKSYLQDQETYFELLRKLYYDLGDLYSSNTDSSQMRHTKKKLIQKFKLDFALHYDSLFVTNVFHAVTDIDINNAFLAIRMTYTMELDLFDSLFIAKQESFISFINYLKTLKKKGDPKSEIRKEIEMVKNSMSEN